MFLASWGHKQPFVAKRWLVSLQTDPCSCSPLLDISMCVHACVCGYMCICVPIRMYVCTCKSGCNDLCLYVGVYAFMYVQYVYLCVYFTVHNASFISFHFDLLKSSPVTFSIISFKCPWAVWLQARDRQTSRHRGWVGVCSVALHIRPPAQYVVNPCVSFCPSLCLPLLHLNPGDTTDPLSGGSLLGNIKCIVHVTH